MAVLFKIALRNLREHRSKTLIIGIIIAVGIAVMIVGNSLTETAARGVRASFIENYTGDLMIARKTRTTFSLFGPQGAATDTAIPRIPDYDRVHQYVASQPEVAETTSQVTGFAVLDFQDNGNSFSILFGIEPQSYRRMFPNAVTMVEGSYLLPGQEGILVSESKREEVKKDLGVDIQVGDSLQLNGFGSAGFRIREVPVRGIFRFNQEVQGLNQISFIDVQSLRALQGMTVSSALQVELSRNETSYLGTQDPDELFGGPMVQSEKAGRGTLSEEQLLGSLGGGGRGYQAQIDSGAWNFILVRLQSERQLPAFLARINHFFEEQGIAAQAVDWKTASGGFGSIAQTVQTVFNVLILIVAVVAVIIIMNTLVISVIERTGEIGTMRALGAQKPFIRRMFVLETLAISGLAGVAGMAVAALIVAVLNATGIRASNAFLQILFGGEVLHPVLPAASLLYAVLVVAAIAVVASLYPVGIALRIQPVKAIQTE